MNHKTRAAQKQRLPTWAAVEASDRSAPVTFSMITSSAYQKLTSTQKELLHICHGQYFWAGANRPTQNDLPNMDAESRRECFFINAGLAKRFGVYGKQSKKLYSDLRALVDCGFIERVSDGKPNFKRSIYRYSTKWKSYRAPAAYETN